MYEHIPPRRDVLIHLVVNNILIFLAVIALILRLVARRIKRNALGLDDYFIMGAMPFAIGMLTIQGLYATLGAGYDITDVPMGNLTMILQLLIAYQIIFATSLLMVKLSILFFYLRVFVNRKLRLAVKICMGLTLVWSAGNIIQVFLICRPFRSSWDITVKGTCGNRQGSFIAIGAFNVVTDFIILTLPIPTVWKLQMPKSGKIGLTFVFTVGLLVSVVAINRMVTLAKIDFDNLTGTMVYPDFWSTTEPILAIISVCLPMLHPVLAFMWPRTFTQSKGSGDQSKSSGYSKKFERLQDSSHRFELADIYTANESCRGESKVTSPVDALPDPNAFSRPQSQGSSEPLKKPGISIRKEWGIQRSR